MSRATATASRRPLVAGVALELELARRGGSETLRVTCEDVQQRNWSRVARARTADGELLFLKQFLDRRGHWHADHRRFEEHGTEVARRALGDRFRVPRIRLSDAERVTIGYEHLEVDAFDSLLRDDPRRFDACRPLLLTRLVELVDALVAAAELDLGMLATKERAYESRGRALCFKGLDARNLGVLRGDEHVAAFDFGRPYRAPVEEAAAKLLVSVGLLNWGRPLSRFVRGPDRELLAEAARALAPWTAPAAVRAELALQRAVRTETIQGRFVEGALKRWGVLGVGRRYLRSLERACEELPG